MAAVIELTEAAAAKVKELLAQEERDDRVLRLAVDDGGCSGMRYRLLFDEAGEADETTEQHGVRVAVDSEAVQYVSGTTIDFSSGLNESGFKILNPRASATCGCGESFSA